MRIVIPDLVQGVSSILRHRGRPTFDSLPRLHRHVLFKKNERDEMRGRERERLCSRGFVENNRHHMWHTSIFLVVLFIFNWRSTESRATISLVFFVTPTDYTPVCLSARICFHSVPHEASNAPRPNPKDRCTENTCHHPRSNIYLYMKAGMVQLSHSLEPKRIGALTTSPET
jgi:hypothetical protein